MPLIFDKAIVERRKRNGDLEKPLQFFVQWYDSQYGRHVQEPISQGAAQELAPIITETLLAQIKFERKK